MPPRNRTIITPDSKLATDRTKGGRVDTFVTEVRNIDRGNRRVTAVLSTAAIDSYDERVLPSAFSKRLDRFRGRPVLIANHMYQLADGRTGQIGQWVDIQVTDDALIGTCEFFDSELSNNWWQPIEDTGKAGFSVGWRTHAWEMQDVVVDGVARKVMTYTDVELVEVSVVTVPSNPEAILAASTGQVIADAFGEPQTTLKRLIKQVESLGEDLGNVLNLVTAINEKKLDAAPGSELHQLVQATAQTMQRSGTHGTHPCGHTRNITDQDPPDTAGLEKSIDDFKSRA